MRHLSVFMTVITCLFSLGFDWAPYYGSYIGIGSTYDSASGGAIYGEVRADLDSQGLFIELAGPAGMIKRQYIEISDIVFSNELTQNISDSGNQNMMAFSLQGLVSDKVFSIILNTETQSARSTEPTITLLNLVADIPSMFPVVLYTPSQIAAVNASATSIADGGHQFYHFCENQLH